MTLNTTYNPTVADGNGTTKEFSYNFNPLAREYLKVSFQINNEWVEQKSGWSATVSENGGVVTFDIAPTTRVAIERDVPEEQPTQYKTSSGFQAEVIEHSFDLLTGMVQELKDETSRSVKVEVGSNISPDEIVAQVERVYDSIDNIDTVGMDKDNVDAVATNISKVNTIANNINDVKTVADNINDVKTVSKNIENVNTVATDIMDVVTVAGITEQTKNVSNNMTAVVDVSNNKSNINNVSVNMPFVKDVSDNIEHVVAVDRNKANIDSVATNKTNINTVSANIAAVNNVSENMADVKNAVQSANDAELWAVGTITEKPEGSSKYWAEQAKNAVQTPDASETVKGIVRLATNDEVTAGTNDSAAITPLKFKQKIAQDLTNPSANTVPSTKAVSDESSRIMSVMDTKLAKKLNVNATTVGEITDLRTPKLNEGNTSTVFIDGYMINSEDDINGCLVAPALNSNGRIINRLLARKKINGNNIYNGLIIGINADGSLYTELGRSSNDNSIVTTVSHGSNYVRFGNGLQICWFYPQITVSGDYEPTITLPIPFKDYNYLALVQQTGRSPSNEYTNTISILGKTTTNFVIRKIMGEPMYLQVLCVGYWY